jgi:formylglycine-generating enzyme required for sulfatase activity
MTSSLARAVAALVFLQGTAALAVTLDLVPVGNPGNPPDTRFNPAGFGAVPYTYAIGKYEVSNGQYREFLAAKAALGDPNGLYNPDMAGDLGGIDRHGSGTPDDPWIFLPKGDDPAWDSRPVNFVSIWDAARFANWMHHGQGDGDTESGAYTGLDNELTFVRQSGARYFLPTENEWYKAAYYDPLRADGPGYWMFPTRSEVRPDNGPPPGTNLVHGSANYSSSQLTAVGAYDAKPSTSYYGTFDQGGNLWEWNETFVIDLYFGLRGGSFDNIYGLEASHRDSYPAYFENRIMGFRLAAAAVPEPGTAALLLAGGLAVWVVRRMRR